MARAETLPGQRPRTLWALRVLAAFIFLPAAALKLVGYPMLVHFFDLAGLGQWLRYVAAFVEIVGGVAVLMPRYSKSGAALLLLLDAGALVAQVVRIHFDWIHVVIIGGILVALVLQDRWARRPHSAT